MYSPKIREDLIPHLYLLAKAQKRPMTHVVNEAIKRYLDRHVSQSIPINLTCRVKNET